MNAAASLTLTVRDSRTLWPGMQRVTLEGPHLEGFCTAGLHFRVVLPRGDDAVPHVRYLTIRAYRRNVAQIDVDIVRHDGSPVSD